MSVKFRNKIKRVLYRPARKRPHMEFVTKRLDDAENALGATIGGIFGGKKVKKSKSRLKSEEEKNGEKK